MATGKGHQAVQGTAYGTVKHEKGQGHLRERKTYPADKVTPPDGVKSRRLDQGRLQETQLK